ncbi:MAG TPA: type IV pilus modification protein PilV [Burkholderiaceae bacterium]|nr:type IV pilus modification protein PilV [Burkholderiaceae bacterium]
MQFIVRSARASISRRRFERGTTLIEVLVSIVVLTVGLLGAVALQAASLRNNQSAHERSVAVMLSYSMSDMLRANATAAKAGSYNVSLSSGEDACPAPSGTDLPSKDLQSWFSALSANLGPNACGGVACNGGTSVCEVSVKWNDSRGKGGSNTQTLKTWVAL